MPIEDLLRILNMTLVVVWFAQMWYLHKWWASRPKEERLILACMPLLLLLILFSSGESILQDVGFGSRVLLFTPILVLCLFSSFKMAKKVRKINKKREEDNSE